MSQFFASMKSHEEAFTSDMAEDTSLPEMKDDPLMPKDSFVSSKKYEHMYDEVNRQDNLFV